MNELTMTNVKEAYKLGFLHGAMAMLQYVKTRLLGQNTPQIDSVTEQLPEPQPTNNVGKILKAVRRIAFEDIKVQQSSNDMWFEIYYTMDSRQNYRIIKEFSKCVTIHHISLHPKRFQCEEDALNSLKEWRYQYIMSNIRLYKQELAEIKRMKIVDENNKRLRNL